MPPAAVATRGPKLVFSSAYEGLFQRALGNQIDASLRERLRQEARLDLDRPLEPAYTFEHWLYAIDVTVKALFPHLSEGEAWNRLGRDLVLGYQQTLVGRATLALAKVIGPRRALGQTVKSFRTGCNYLDTRLDEVSPTSFRLWVNEVGPHPEFTQGTLTAGLEVAGANAPVVKVLTHNGHAAFYGIDWTP